MQNGLWIFALAAFTYYALFRLPFRFPSRQRLSSASYAFGFNNSLAILALAGLIAAVALFYLLRRTGADAQRIHFPLDRVAAGRSVRIAFAIITLLYAVLTFAMYLYDLRSFPWLMWETRHFLHRTWLMDIYGMNPYTDFSAEYGPILNSTPVWIYWLLKPFGASHDQAYFACHFLLNLGGVWCVYYVLSRAAMPSAARVTALVLLSISGFAFYMGLNGVLVRYVFAFAALLLGHRVLTRGLSRPNGRIFWLSSFTTVLLLLGANILLSPEVAVAFTFAWLAYAVLMLRRDPRILTASLLALIGAALLCWILLPREYYGSLVRFSQGANNLPLLPVPHLLLYIFTLLVVVPPLLARSLRMPADGNVAGAALSGALGILCVVMIPGALGRCDAPHVLFYGMGAAMLLMIRLANKSHRAFVSYAVTYAAVFVVLMQVINLRVFYGIPPGALLSRYAVERLRLASGTERPDAATLHALDRYPRLGLPFATFGDPAVERYVVLRGQLEPEYYMSVVGIYGTAALERKLADVGKMEYLLVPREFTTRSPSDQCATYLRDIRKWFLYPASLLCRAEPLDPGAALNSFIADHYTPVEQVGSWVVMRRMSRSTDVPSGV